MKAVACIRMRLPDSESFVNYFALYNYTKFFLFCFINFHLYLSIPLYFSNFIFLVEAMSDEIQPVTVGSETYIVADARVGNDKDDGSKLTVHPGCQSWTVAQNKVDHPTVSDAMRFSAMFCDGRSMNLSDQQGIQRETYMGARERRRNVIESWCPGNTSAIDPFDMPFARDDQD